MRKILHRAKEQAVNFNQKTAAVARVEMMAGQTAGRLSWVEWTDSKRVCLYTGPHRLCFHGTRQTRLLAIPGTKAANSAEKEPSRRLIYLGDDGKLYRYEGYKIYEVQLMDRPTARSIEALIPKLEAIPR